MSTALLIIDMQQALCSGTEAAFGIDRVLERVNLLGRRARAAGAPVVLIQHEEEEGPLTAESPGWQLVQGIMTSDADLRIRKRTPNSFHGTGLDALLRGLGVTRLVICGLQTDFCIDTTVRQALPLGYAVVLASDAHSTIDGVITAEQAIAHHNRTLGFMGGFDTGVDVGPAAGITFAS